MSNDQQRSGNAPVPGTRRKAVPITMATGPAEYTAGQQDLPVQLTSLADMLQWAQVLGIGAELSLTFTGLFVSALR